MTETTNNYAEVLYGLDISKEAVRDTEEIFRSVPKVKSFLKIRLFPLRKRNGLSAGFFPEKYRIF